MRFSLAVLLAALVACVVPAGPAFAQGCAGPVAACERETPGALALIAPGRAVRVVVGANEEPGVPRAAADLVADLRAVGGGNVRLAADARGGGTTIIAGTLGHSGPVDALVAAGKLDVGGLKGQWEGYVEQVVDNPFPGVARALVIAGSDRRGTIFGLYDISAKVGVSPWTYWADVPPQHHARLWLTAGRMADHPVVKYRGIFLNDEDPALGGWARAKFGGLNHAFYEKVFTLILRSKANFLWPAMWGKSIWEDDPASAPLADAMGVVLGTSHHEPMGRAQADWQKHGHGPWDYTQNADTLRAFWREGMQRRGTAETLVTVGMRGDGDKPMTEGTAIGLLERIVADQRRIIADTTGKPPEQTPQVWALYKEVQDYYDKGMRVPDDVTLLFSDDNWGNLRRLPEPGAPPRAGGYGIYYHFDYVGGPRNYKWIDTNNIARVWQQMRLARQAGADRLWIVNVGDLKPMEMPISFFLDMAWNPDRMNLDALGRYPTQWAAQQFGPGRATAIGDLLARYGQLAGRRKPELIDAATYDTPEWADVVTRWDRLEADARRVEGSISADRRDAYYELVLHRIQALANLHRLYHAVALNWQAGTAGKPAEAAHQAAIVRALFANDSTIRRRYEVDTAGGKWTSMMAQTHIGYTGWQQPDADVMPALWTASSSAPVRPAFVAPIAVATRPTRVVNGGGIQWLTVPRLGATEDGLVADNAAAPPIEHPGGSSPRLVYHVRVNRGGPAMVEVTAAPGLDVRGRGEHRYAVSVDGGPPTTVNLLANETEQSWNMAVADNRRVGRTAVTLTPGEHDVSVWMVDPAVVFEGVRLVSGP